MLNSPSDAQLSKNRSDTKSAEIHKKCRKGPPKEFNPGPQQVSQNRRGSAPPGQCDGTSGSAHLAAEADWSRWDRPQSQHPPPQGSTGPTAGTAPTLTTVRELKQQVAKLEAMRKTAQELGDQELLANIDSKLRHAQTAKAESRPGGAQMDSALSNLEKAKLLIERAQEKKERAQDELRAAKRHEAEVESQVQGLRELMAQDPEKTQQEPDDLTVLIQLTDQLTALLCAETGPQTAGPLLAQLQQGLRAFAANCSTTASRSRSVSSGSTLSGSWKQSVDFVMTETELDQVASKHEAAPANERDTITREFLTKRRKRGAVGPAAWAHHLHRVDVHPMAGERVGEAKKPGPGNKAIAHITKMNRYMTMELRITHERGLVGRTRCRSLPTNQSVFSKCSGTPFPPWAVLFSRSGILGREDSEIAGSDDSLMQSDDEVEREAGATPDPSWHSETDVSATTNTTASTPREIARYGYREERLGEARNPTQ